MPEQLKPCPACGSDNVECLVCTINADENQDVHFHIACEACYTSGPIADNGKIAADKWNSLPRRPDYNDVDCAGCPERRRSALTWTTEPPKVPGFYFLKMASGTISMVYLSEADIMDNDWHGSIGQWVANAGPIHTPREPEES